LGFQCSFLPECRRVVLVVVAVAAGPERCLMLLRTSAAVVAAALPPGVPPSSMASVLGVVFVGTKANTPLCPLAVQVVARAEKGSFKL
jgi:hypothetical protein